VDRVVSFSGRNNYSRKASLAVDFSGKSHNHLRTCPDSNTNPAHSLFVKLSFPSLPNPIEVSHGREHHPRSSTILRIEISRLSAHRTNPVRSWRELRDRLFMVRPSDGAVIRCSRALTGVEGKKKQIEMDATSTRTTSSSRKLANVNSTSIRIAMRQIQRTLTACVKNFTTAANYRYGCVSE
jgi:hypothetical protein